MARDTDGGSAGVCMTRHAAMEAMSRALVRAGRPANGYVAPVILTEPAQGTHYYLRGFPRQTAVYDGWVIRWS